MMKVYCHPNCSTCKKAIAFLKKKNQNFEIIDLRDTPPKNNEIDIAIDNVKGDFTKLFNKSGLAYRELKLKEEIKTMTNKKARELLTTNGLLVKRPLLINEKNTLVGFKQEEWDSFFI